MQPTMTFKVYHCKHNYNHFYCRYYYKGKVLIDAWQWQSYEAAKYRGEEYCSTWNAERGIS